MKKLLLLFCLFFTCIAGMYILPERVEPKGEKVKKLFDKRHYSVSELNQINFEKKRERKIREGGSLSHSKFDHPDEYTNYHWAIRTRDSENNPVYPQGYKMDALKKALKNSQYKLKSSLRTNSLEWIERGPSNVPGRTRALVVLPQDPQSKTWVAGAAGGGIWKTNDGGISWQNKTPELPTLAISWIALCDESPNILYAATGEANGGGRGLIGNGVFKSEDAGESWVHLSSTAGTGHFTLLIELL